MEATLFDKTFRDNEGNLAIAQKPNLPSIVAGIALLLLLTPIEGKLRLAVTAIAYGTAYTWAWMELFQGVNYFRRSLGLIVLLGAIGVWIW
ncbi:hypothetical protein C7271_18320 [filamentous cyanobacterium CCP5]|nr:hypothetical protein C7271_18320 [filamentous cyanobacterium CCP5]